MVVRKIKRIKDLETPASANITGANIRKARLAAGLTQKQLSDKLETMAVYVCRGSVSRIESGVRVVTDIELKAISTIVHVPIEKLFAQDA